MDSDFNWTIHFSDSRWCAEVVFPRWRFVTVFHPATRTRRPAYLVVFVVRVLQADCLCVLWCGGLRLLGFPTCCLGSALRSFGLCGGWVVEGSRLPLGVMSLHSVAFVAQCDSGCLVCCFMRDYWLLHLTLRLLLHGLLVIYFSLWPVCFLILWLSMMFVTVLFFVFVAFVLICKRFELWKLD